MSTESALTEEAVAVVNGSPRILSYDYVNALVLNESGEALVFPIANPDTGHVAWHLLSGQMKAGEDPLMAVQRLLQDETGSETHDWTYLSSYLMDAGHNGSVQHLFCAQKVKQTTQSIPQTAATATWIPLKELRYGLLDGRINNINHAMTISLAFLTILK